MASFHINKVRERLMLTSSEQITAIHDIAVICSLDDNIKLSHTLLMWNDAMI
jgi:hypothetical protein